MIPNHNLDRRSAVFFCVFAPVFRILPRSNFRNPHFTRTRRLAQQNDNGANVQMLRTVWVNTMSALSADN